MTPEERKKLTEAGFDVSNLYKLENLRASHNFRRLEEQESIWKRLSFLRYLINRGLLDAPNSTQKDGE